MCLSPQRHRDTEVHREILPYLLDCWWTTILQGAFQFVGTLDFEAVIKSEGHIFKTRQAEAYRTLRGPLQCHHPDTSATAICPIILSISQLTHFPNKNCFC